MNTRKRILLVIPSTTYRTADFMAAANQLDVEVVVASDHKQAMAALVPDTTLALNFSSVTQIREKVLDFHLRKPIHAVVGVDDRSSYVAAVIGETLGVRHNLPAAVYATINKHEMRCLLEAAQVPCPGFEVCSVDQNPAIISQKISFPCVLKPLFLSASRGVIRAENASEFAEAFSDIADLLKLPEVRKRAVAGEERQILVEQYIPGIEVAVEAMLLDGEVKTLAIFDKPDPLEGPHFVETIYVTPSRLPGYVQMEVTHLVRDAARAIGLRTGPVHAEVRLNEKGSFLIEIAARSIGGLCARMLRFQNDISLEKLILQQALGQDISAIQRERQASGVFMLPLPTSGILESVDGLDEARNIEGVSGVIITIPNGQAVTPMPWGGRYLGFIFAHGELPEFVEDVLRKAWSHLKVRIVQDK